MATIRELREREALSQRDLAERADVSRATVVQIERGTGTLPTPAVRRKLAGVFGIHPSDIDWPAGNSKEDGSAVSGA